MRFRSRQPAHHGSHRQFELFGDLAIRAFFEIETKQHQFEFIGQFVDRGLQQLAVDFPTLGHFVRREGFDVQRHGLFALRAAFVLRTAVNSTHHGHKPNSGPA